MRLRTPVLRATITAIALVLTLSCAPTLRSTAPRSQASPPLGELWEEPTDLETRDLFWGQWGQKFAPAPDQTYRFIEEKTTGFSPGFTVEDERGITWSVKQGPEAHVEVVVSRILAAVGYHQPPVYFLDSWTKKGGPGAARQSAGRFRPKGVGLDERGDWSWQRNPFIGTRPYGGLLSLMMLLNESDLKNDNNSLYELDRSVPLSRARTWYVVRDLGAGLGETGRVRPRRGDPFTFAKRRLLKHVTAEGVQFNYHGRHQELVRQLSKRDLEWMTRLVSRLSDTQWRDAFRAGGYGSAASDLFISTIKARLAEARYVQVRTSSSARHPSSTDG